MLPNGPDILPHLSSDQQARFFNESWTKFHNVVRPPGLVHHGVRHLGREDHVQGHVVIVILIDLPLVT